MTTASGMTTIELLDEDKEIGNELDCYLAGSRDPGTSYPLLRRRREIRTELERRHGNTDPTRVIRRAESFAKHNPEVAASYRR